MPRRGENIRKRKDGRWEARFIKRYDSEGKAVYGSVYGKTYFEVKKKQTEILEKLSANALPLNEIWSGKLKLDTEGVISGHGMYNRGNTICIPGQHKPRSEQEVYHEIRKPRTAGHRPADL